MRIGEDLFQHMSQITSILLVEDSKAGKVAAGKSGTRPPARLKLVTEFTKRQLRQMLAIQFQRQDLPAKRLDLVRPISSNVVVLHRVETLTKLTPHGTKRTCDLPLPRHHRVLGAHQCRLIEGDAAIREPKRPEQQIDVEIMALLEGEASRFDARSVIEIDRKCPEGGLRPGNPG